MMQRTAKKQEIDQHPTATQEEKDATKAKVDAEVQKAKDAITQANSNNDVDQVQNSETATIAGIQVDAVKKQMLNKQLMMRRLRKMKLTNIQQLHKKKKMRKSKSG